LLRGYFVPTEEERALGLKVPTKAHYVIAELVAKGYIKVILTTNFDSLLEQALEAQGVQPAVVSDASAMRA
jgi:NAD-dependent SIR2 family protein deacetylase